VVAASIRRGAARRSHRRRIQQEDAMSIAKVSEISATSTKGFADAIEQGIARSHKTLRNVRSAWVKEQHVRVLEGAIAEFQVNLMVTFVIDD
jgi:flavin-binding protein dodecin